MLITREQLKDFLAIIERENYDAILIANRIYYRRDGKWYDGKGNERESLDT